MAMSDEAGWGKLGTARVILLPVIWPGAGLLGEARQQPPERRQWDYVVAFLACASLSIATLTITRLSTGIWIHPSWY